MAIRLLPMVHVGDLESSLAFYRALGAIVVFSNRKDFAMLDIAGARLTLIAHPPNPDRDEGIVELNFEVDDETLDRVQERLICAGATLAQEVTATGWGHQLILRSPDGLIVKINRIDRT